MNGFEEGLTEAFLEKLVERPENHAKFLNTLSMLEYMGARKIFKSQQAETISISILYHAADEIRHAKLLKKAALEMSDGLLDSYKEEHLFCGAVARRYFQTVDHLSESQRIGLTSAQRYALTTWLVEKRVLEIYPLYESILAKNDRLSAQQTVIRAILKDEERHLTHVNQSISEALGVSGTNVKILIEHEEHAFQELAQAWFALERSPMPAMS